MVPLLEHFKVTDTSTRKTPESRKVWVNFIPNIDLGHVLTMISFAAAMVVTWNLQDRRITIMEQKQLESDRQVTEMKSDVKEIKTTLTQIQTSLAVQAYITSNSGNKGK